MALSKKQYNYIWGALLAIFLLLIFDQTSKIWVKTHMQLYESIEIFSWFRIYFIENPGMAFGIDLIDTHVLTVFRLVVVGVFSVWIFKLIQRGTFKFGFILCLSFILAGALGNIIDCVFYGTLFEHSYGQVAQFLPEKSYSTFFSGKVVDMLSFPLIRTTWPASMPLWGGKEFVFFSPIFNVADSAICVNVFVLLIFYRKSLLIGWAKEKSMNEE